MRISDWSSDVCSSDLLLAVRTQAGERGDLGVLALVQVDDPHLAVPEPEAQPGRRVPAEGLAEADRKSVVEGKSVSVRVGHGGRSILKKKKRNYISIQLIDRADNTYLNNSTT